MEVILPDGTLGGGPKDLVGNAEADGSPVGTRLLSVAHKLG